jgi:hypothetical protein
MTHDLNTLNNALNLPKMYLFREWSLQYEYATGACSGVELLPLYFHDTLQEEMRKVFHPT